MKRRGCLTTLAAAALTATAQAAGTAGQIQIHVDGQGARGT